MKPRWRKVIHDLFDNKMRTALVVASIAVGVFSIGVIAGAYVIIGEDMSRSYASNNPANIELRNSLFDDNLITMVENIRDVDTVEGRYVFNIRVRQPGTSTWTNISMIGVDDFDKLSINQLRLIEGAPNPAKKEVLLEKKAAAALGVGAGTVLEFQLADGSIKMMPVIGVVQDQASGAGDFLASPSAFVAMTSLPSLQQEEMFNRLLITLETGQNDDVILRTQAALIKDKIEKNHYSVYRTHYNRTNLHPMASIVQAVLGILGALGVLILFLSSSLIANTLNALLNQHMRHIGVMKLVGGRRNQILGMYLTLIFGFSLIALLISVPLGGQGAYGLSLFIADKLNFSLLGYRLIPIAFLIQIVVGLAVPILVGLVPVINGSRVSVQHALSNETNQMESQKPANEKPDLISKASLGINQQLAHRGIHIPRPLLISLRNIFRRKKRLALTLFTLTMGGAIFIGVFNVRVTLHDYLGQIGKYFLADITLDFDRPYRLDDIAQKASLIPGVEMVEGWTFASAEVQFPDGTPADNLTILAPPVNSKLVSPILVEGRWLLPGDTKAIAISEGIYSKFPNLKAGQTLRMKVNGKEDDWKIVGIFKFVTQQGTIAYSTYEYISYLTHAANKSFSFRVVTTQHDRKYQDMMSGRLDKFFREQGYHIREAQTGRSTLKKASESIDILITFLLIMALLTASVGSMGLAGSMSMNVLERTREIGIMRSIGAKDNKIMQMVVEEGVVVGGISWLLGSLLSIPFSYLLTSIVSQAIFNSSITVKFTINGYLLWLLVVLGLSAIASILPARNAAKLTIREVLAYE